MRNDLMAVYGRGNLGEDQWESILKTVSAVSQTVQSVVTSARKIISPTEKANTSYITGTPTQAVSPLASFPIVPVAIAAGALLMVVFVLKR